MSPSDPSVCPLKLSVSIKHTNSELSCLSPSLFCPSGAQILLKAIEPNQTRTLLFVLSPQRLAHTHSSCVTDLTDPSCSWPDISLSLSEERLL